MLSDEERIVAAIRRIIRGVDLHSQRLVEAHGLTGPQLAILLELSRLGSATPKQLSLAVHLSQATVSGILQRLERRGLVERRPSSRDRRSIQIELTAVGHSVLEHSPSLLQDRFRELLSGLQEWERLQILATLQRVASLMGVSDLSAAPHLITGELPEPSSAVLADGAGGDLPPGEIRQLG